MTRLIRKTELPSVYIHNGYWLDIVHPDDCEKAINETEMYSV